MDVQPILNGPNLKQQPNPNKYLDLDIATQKQHNIKILIMFFNNKASFLMCLYFTTNLLNMFQCTQKIKLLAQMIKMSQNCVVYTGAGISKAAGIGDYASKAKKSVSGKQNPSLNRLNAQPTFTHYALVSMEKKKYIKHWLQQNHDGLAQKAGFPVSKLNQIHGSWFDKKNPVVLMDDKLNPKNYAQLQQWEQKADLCIAIGTSLCGMRSDGIAQKCASKKGLVIINLQCTPYDKYSSLRIYGNLQTIFHKLAAQLKLKVDTKTCIQNPYQWNK